MSHRPLSGPGPRRRLRERGSNRIFCNGRDNGSEPSLRGLTSRLWSFERPIVDPLRSLIHVALASIPSLPWTKLPSLLLRHHSTPPPFPPSCPSLPTVGGLALRVGRDPGRGAQDRGERLFRSCLEKGERPFVRCLCPWETFLRNQVFFAGAFLLLVPLRSHHRGEKCFRGKTSRVKTSRRKSRKLQRNPWMKTHENILHSTTSCQSCICRKDFWK